jgi:hypothetical protein
MTPDLARPFDGTKRTDVPTSNDDSARREDLLDQINASIKCSLRLRWEIQQIAEEAHLNMRRYSELMARLRARSP